MEDTETEVITGVDVFESNINEGSKLKDLIEKEQENDLKTKSIIADALYDSIENRRFCLEENIEAYIPTRRKTKLFDRFGYSPFLLML